MPSVGNFEVVRVMPDEGGDQQYRIKGSGEAHERVVNERDLEKA
jgi:hypothetical protein